MFVIAGANGHVGFAAAHALLKAKRSVRVIVHSAIRRGHWEKDGAEVVVGSLDDANFLTQALKGAEGFFALTPPNLNVSDYIAWQHKVADATASAVKASDVSHVVLLSSVGAQHPRGTGPIAGLHYFENALRKTGVRLTAIRACGFQENIAGAIAAAENAGIYPNFTGSDDRPVPMVATKDIGAQVAYELMNPPVGSITVSLEGPSYTEREIAQKIGEAIGNKDLPIVRIAPEAHIKTFVDSGMPVKFAELVAEMLAAEEKGLLSRQGDRLAFGQTPIEEVIHAMTANLHH